MNIFILFKANVLFFQQMRKVGYLTVNAVRETPWS